MKPTPLLTFGSLFAGIGGFDLGFERAGMVCKWQVEIDDYANRVLAKHWPAVHRERDVRQCGRRNLEPVDVICGGFPCQDVSYAGQGAGLEGERSGLFYEIIRLIGDLGPRVVVLENVAALLTRGLGEVLRALAAIGFDAEWCCLPAAGVGAPHVRDRVFVVAYANGILGEARLRIFDKDHWEWKVSREGYQECVSAQRWGVETAPRISRVDDGVPDQVDRLRCLGNAVVPQVAEWIGKRIVQTVG